MTSEYDEGNPWQANLETSNPETSISSSEVIMTTVVKVASEARPAQKQSELSDAERAKRRMNKIAVTLLCYPIAYLCLTMPISVARVAFYCGAEVSPAVSYIVVAIFGSSGWVNVLLYTIPRKGIVSWDWILFWRRPGCRKYSNPDSAVIPTDSYFPRSGSAHAPISTSAFDAAQNCSVLPMRRLPSEKCNCGFDMDINSNQQRDPRTPTLVAVPDRAKLSHARWCAHHLTSFSPASSASNRLTEVEAELGRLGAATQ
jgi:G protein-coupled glucose receptor regulating Gpa2 C-term